MKYLIFLFMLINSFSICIMASENPYLDKMEAITYEIRKIEQQKAKCEQNTIKYYLGMCRYDKYLSKLYGDLNIYILFSNQWDKENNQ